MQKSIYTVLYHSYEANHYDGTPWDENDVSVISHHVSLRAANLVIIDMLELNESGLDLDRDLAGEHEDIENEVGEGYIRHVNGRLDVMRSLDTNSGTRMQVVVKPLDKGVWEYGDDDHEETSDEEADVEEDKDEEEIEVVSVAAPTLKRSAPPDTDEIQYMGTKKVRAI